MNFDDSRQKQVDGHSNMVPEKVAENSRLMKFEMTKFSAQLGKEVDYEEKRLMAIGIFLGKY